MYSRVPECQITTYYYVGFAYLMMRRYQDAIRVFANILLYIQRTRNMFQRSTYKYEMVSVHYVVPRHWVILCHRVCVWLGVTSHMKICPFPVTSQVGVST